MATSLLSMEHPTCFQLKANFATCAILQLFRYDLDALQHQLVDTIRRAPNFFIGSPVVIDLEKVQAEGPLDFVKMKYILMEHGLAPMGVRGGTTEQAQAAATAGLPCVNIGKTTVHDSAKKTNDEESVKKQDNKAQHPTTKLIVNPIRSGTRIYARDSDLIVIAQVSSGAELLADGHIHVYGTLRGRALAGVQGNTQARIFCHTLDAELISIAGFYLTKEDMQLFPKQDGIIQIYLEGEQVRIGAI